MSLKNRIRLAAVTVLSSSLVVLGVEAAHAGYRI
ncbi:hypothetical protein BJ968_001871 [Kineococcus aurantiacus]|uniref:Uncharacterized protein n=1 Tax=Kineococcus aurantiacus TaxID=37633 RepID=A0A7Y9DKK9_9ACTN|nr:hypothetical protein [Kineococcus aurantiacus]